MTDEDAHFWQSLPRWLKLTTLFAAVPAWCLFAVSVITDTMNSTVAKGALLVFAAVALLQIFFAWRAGRSASR
jgi:hypothetical protein